MVEGTGIRASSIGARGWAATCAGNSLDSVGLEGDVLIDVPLPEVSGPLIDWR